MSQSGDESSVAFLSQLQPARRKRRALFSQTGGKIVKNLVSKRLSETKKSQKTIWRGQGVARNQRWIQTPESRATETSLQVRPQLVAVHPKLSTRSRLTR